VSGLAFTASWSDGTPHGSAAKNADAGGDFGTGASLQLTATAGTALHVARLYAVVEGGSAQLAVALSDSSATAPPVTENSGTLAVLVFELAVTYRAASDGQTLTLTWSPGGGFALVALASATLQ
jgi:hypothetical protein